MQPNDVLTNFDRSRPVVNLEAEVRFLAEGGSIDMEQRDCQTRQGEDVACSKIRLCTRYSGLGVEQKLSKLRRLQNLNLCIINYLVDIESKNYHSKINNDNKNMMADDINSQQKS